MVFSARSKRCAMLVDFFSSMMAVNSTVRTCVAILVRIRMKGTTKRPRTMWLRSPFSIWPIAIGATTVTDRIATIALEP